MAVLAEHPVIRYVRLALDIPGDIIECGSWRLDSALKIASICPLKLVYACDTFHGMPEPGAEDVHLTDPSKGHKLGDFPSNWNEVSAMAEGTNVIPVPGYFHHTLPMISKGAGPFSMIYIDCDLYESAKPAIDILWPCLSEHGILVADDYTNPATPGIKKVMDRYFAGRFHPDENGLVMVRKGMA